MTKYNKQTIMKKAPLEIVMLEADLLAGNEARARVKFKIDPKFADEQEGHNFMILELWMENGRADEL